jgi:hypothetical protein
MVTARFRVTRVNPFGLTDEEFAERRKQFEDGDIKYGPQAEVEMTPDYAGGKNAEWCSATPAGVIRLTISNLAALDYLAPSLKPGRSLHIEFSDAPED